MSRIVLPNNSSAPATPASGDSMIYPRGGVWYQMGSDGVEHPLGSVTDAVDVNVADTAGNFVETDVEGVLEELSDAISGAGGGATDLEGLSDVDLTSPATRQGLFYDGANFINQFDPANRVPPQTKTATFTASLAEHSYLCDTSGGSITANLPTAVGNAGKEFVIKKIDASANTITIDPNGTQTIDGFTTFVLDEERESLEIYSDGSNWRIRAHPYGGADSFSVPAGGDTDDVLTKDSGTSGDYSWQPVPGAGGGGVDVQLFDTPGTFTWNKPAGAEAVAITCIGGGGGAGSGRRGAASTNTGGGAGGAGGSRSEALLPASALGSTVPVAVGAAGSGGAAVTTDSTGGNPGTAGGTSSFGTTPSFHCRAFGGALGAGGSAGSATGGQANTIDKGTFPGGTGSNSSATTQPGQSGSPSAGGGGGASGSSITSSNSGGGSTNTGGSTSLGAVGPSCGTSTGNNGGAGTSSGAGLPGSGGGGGATGDTAGTVAGGTGGQGGGYGGGGGGGGASRNGANSGAGGAGGSGCVLVISYLS